MDPCSNWPHSVFPVAGGSYSHTLSLPEPALTDPLTPLALYSLAPSSLVITCSLVHPPSLKSLPHGHMGPPTHGLVPVAALRPSYTHMHSEQKCSGNRKEFSKKIEQTALIRHGAQAHKQKY